MELWDETKNARNKADHGIGLENAYRVFEDEFALTREDYIDENAEMRYQTIGIVAGVLILVAHVERTIGGTEAPWLISARKADKYEETQYFRRRENESRNGGAQKETGR
jgi:uncharacterized DUF497 family protein